MINYTRTRWYGLSYMLQWHGSLIPRALPAVTLAGSLSYVMTAGTLDPYFGWDLKTFFEDPFSMQMFGVVR